MVLWQQLLKTQVKTGCRKTALYSLWSPASICSLVFAQKLRVVKHSHTTAARMGSDGGSDLADDNILPWYGFLYGLG